MGAQFWHDLGIQFWRLILSVNFSSQFWHSILAVNFGGQFFAINFGRQFWCLIFILVVGFGARFLLSILEVDFRS